VTFTLPYPPTTNHAYLVRGNRKIKTQTARNYADKVGWLVADHVRTGEQPPQDFTDKRLAVTITVCPPDKRKRDLANTEKLATDAVMQALGLDDSQVDKLTIERGPVERPNGKLVYRLDPDEETPW